MINYSAFLLWFYAAPLGAFPASNRHDCRAKRVGGKQTNHKNRKSHTQGIQSQHVLNRVKLSPVVMTQNFGFLQEQLRSSCSFKPRSSRSLWKVLFLISMLFVS